MDPVLAAALAGALRAIIAAGVSYAAAKGYIGNDATGDLIAAVTTVGVAGWSVAQKIATVPAATQVKAAK